MQVYIGERLVDENKVPEWAKEDVEEMKKEMLVEGWHVMGRVKLGILIKVVL